MRTKRKRILPFHIAGTAVLLAACTSTPVTEDSPSVESSAKAIIGGGTFGTYAGEEYQNGWQPSFCIDPWWWWKTCYAVQTTNAFTTGMVVHAHATRGFRFDLNNTKVYLEDTADEIEPETVDVLWLFTHGSVDGTVAHWYMWNQGVTAQSNYMRLGDEAKGLKLFISYACHTLFFGDGDMWATRLDPIFRGGLKIMVGSHDIINWGETMNEAGDEFAEALGDNRSILTAWHYALDDWNFDNDATIVATGSSWGDCFDRLQNTNYDQVLDNTVRPPLRYGVGWAYCLWYWDDL